MFDPERLSAIIDELAAEVKPSRRVGGEQLAQLLVAVDGSVVKTLSTIAEAAYLKTKQGDSRSAWRPHTHFNELNTLGSSYVCRVRDNSRYEVLEERSLSAGTQAASVLADAHGELGTTGKATARPNHPIRLVLVKCTPHKKTGGRKGARRGRPRTACCALPRTSKTFLPRSSLTSIGTGGRLSCSASSSTCWAAGTC